MPHNITDLNWSKLVSLCERADIHWWHMPERFDSFEATFMNDN